MWWECAVGVESLCFRRKIENISKRCGDFLFCGLHTVTLLVVGVFLS